MARVTKERLRQEITQFLDGADLSKLSSKKVRCHLQEILNTDLTNRKKEIDQILMRVIAENETELARVTQQAQDTKDDTTDADGDAGANETAEIHQAVSEPEEQHEDESPPPAKKKKQKKKKKDSHPAPAPASAPAPAPARKPKEKKEKTKKKLAQSPKKKEAPKSQSRVEDSEEEQTINDEELAWKLHQEETRRTRNHSARKVTHTKRKAPTKRDGAKTGYGADVILSPELANILGTDRMSRHRIVKKMWEIIRERNLMDPKNKQFHICDDQLFKVFGQRRIRTFSMMKYLNAHVKDPRNLTTAV